MKERDEFFAELETTGELQVRTNIAQKYYGFHNGKMQLAEEWLRIKDQDRRDSADAREEAARREQINIARSAKNAAWVAAIAAIIAAICAAAAVIINPPWASSPKPTVSASPAPSATNGASAVTPASALASH